MKYDFVTVNEVFKKYKIINVPYYQRDYVWGNKNNGRNLYKFIDDIITQYEEDSSKDYFIGTLAFCSAKVNDVIDGQQRITSIVLLLTVLANTRCSEVIKKQNDALINPDDKFIIQEEHYLTEEIKYCFKIDNKFNAQGYKADISKTIDRIKEQIKVAWDDMQVNWYDNLYEYILNKIKLICLEYNTISESLKYFLNINSLSISLSQNDIFFSILSQAMRISESPKSIYTIKEKIVKLSENRGLSVELDGYKAYDVKENKAINNIIYLFLSAYYQKDKDIHELNEIGIGKWMSFYRNDVFNDNIKAKKFTDHFFSYLKDFEIIYNFLSQIDVILDPKTPLYLAWVLLQYESYCDILKTISIIFMKRHNYFEQNLYDEKGNISEQKLNEIAKRLNLTLLWNYIRSSNKRLDGFITNIELNQDGNYKKSIEDIYDDIDVAEIFNLNYNDGNTKSKLKIKDESRIIKVILGLQEAYLNMVANPDNEFACYFSDALSELFSIEHLYSVKEYEDETRRINWNKKRNLFFDDIEFYTTRFKFENLSLLNKRANSSAGDNVIYDKLTTYKKAKNILKTEYEYLIQSFVEDSEYYKNTNIQALNLPKRVITNIDQNTWELPPCNREYNEKLLKLALEQVAKD